MKSKIKNIIYLLFLPALFLAAGCKDDYTLIPDVEDGSIVISGSLAIPDMDMVQSRALGNAPGSGLKLTVLEFDLVPDKPDQSFISKVYQATTKTPTNVANGGTVSFEVTLNLDGSNTAKQLQFVVANDFVNPGNGSIASLLPTMSVSGNNEAYWGKIDFEDGYETQEVNGTLVLTNACKAKFNNIPVIRNFARIGVEEGLDNFELLGFDIVNVPTSGTIAPWDSGDGESRQPHIPDLLNGSAMWDYNHITDVSCYSGTLPAGVGFYNQEFDAAKWVDGVNSNMRSTEYRYLYEHPYEPDRRTYLIVQGNYRPTDENGNLLSPVRGFYKVDIGNLNTDGTFQYYNLIRNISYNVVIQSVSAPGMATVAEAIDRAPFNNLLAATETSSMLNVSDGDNMLIVNDVNHIIVNEGETIDILYRYIQNVTGTQSPGNTIPTYIVGPGNVIAKKANGDWDITEEKDSTNSAGTWKWLKVTTNAPDPLETFTQTITIVDGKGLGRTITLISHQPWQYVPIVPNTTPPTTAIIQPGSYNWYETAASQNFSYQAGAEMTVYFNLPNGLPDSMFPLDFILEAKYQGLENNKIGTMTVTYGPSLFDPQVTAIQYIKTVSLNEYKFMYKARDPKAPDSDVIDVGKPNTNHTIRCRFTTITEVAAGSPAEVHIHNPYFSPDAVASASRVLTTN